MSEMDKYYQILGLNPGASEEEIKEAYKDLVNVWHPDRFLNNPRLREKANEKLKEIILAYKKLTEYVADSYSYDETFESEKEQSAASEDQQKQQPPPREPPPKSEKEKTTTTGDEGHGGFQPPPKQPFAQPPSDEELIGKHVSRIPLSREIASVLSFILVAYFLSVSIMACYYWYRDVKENEGFFRALYWSPIVGFFKASHWPYYVFFQRNTQQQHDPPSVIGLQRSISYMNSARTLLQGLPTSKDPAKDLETIRNLLQSSQLEAEKIDRNELNKLKPGFGDAVKDNYLVAVRYYNSALSPGGDRNDVHRGDASLAIFYQWMDAHAKSN